MEPKHSAKQDQRRLDVGGRIALKYSDGMDGSSETCDFGENGHGRTYHGLLFGRHPLDYAVNLGISSFFDWV